MLTFVLGGGGARGALQAGALRALIEAGYRPELIVGASVGALNGAHLALHGSDHAGIERLCQTWNDAAAADLLSARRAWLAARALLHLQEDRYYHRMRSFLISHGISPELRFAELQHCRLAVVATDLNRSGVHVFGASGDDLVLDALLASAALPPWIPPIAQDDHLFSDGGISSNLPIEPALSQGATEIIALDITDRRGIETSWGEKSFAPTSVGIGAFIAKVMLTASERQLQLEMALATARNIPVRVLYLQSEQIIPVWDFSRAHEYIETGYAQAVQAIADWPPAVKVEPQHPAAASPARWWQRIHLPFRQTTRP